MAYIIPDSLPDSASQRYADFELEATQLSQAVYSQASQGPSSQVDPRRKYWAVLIPINSTHSILKIPWTRTRLQIGRGAQSVGNHVILQEKRVSNRHCRISLSLHGISGSEAAEETLVQKLKDADAEPEVWIEDLQSSNGTFVNGARLTTRRMLQHGDEVSLGHVNTIDKVHDVRYIFRSVGRRGQQMDERAAGEVYQKYQILHPLGKGTFAEVSKAVDVETGDMRAIKQIVKHRFAHDKKTLGLFQREIDICTQLHHENICRLIESYSDPQHICLVLEYIDGGDLLEYIMDYDGPGIPESEVAQMAFEICSAMAYCHENGITHRDLKPENILLTKETETQARIIKIADFGLAKMVHAKTLLESMVGTPQYLAPEVVMQTRQRPGYENVVDSWSVGIIVYSMLTKALPFDDAPGLTLEQRIRQRYNLEYDREPLHALDVSDTCIDFISRLIEREPSKRMTMKQALKHEWLTESSSQPNESQQSQGLGGDSMWNIQAFESENDIEDEDASRRWSRPMTASTNFDASGTSDNFSQPMEGLRLNSKAPDYPLSPPAERSDEMECDEDRQRTATAGPSPDTSLEHDGEGDVLGNGTTNGNGKGHNSANLTPTKAKPTAKVFSSMDVDSVPGSMPCSSMDIDSSVPAAPLSNKRKQSLFSSGSLTPPPPSLRDRDTTPQASKARAAATPAAASPANDPGPRRLTRSSTAKAPVKPPITGPSPEGKRGKRTSPKASSKATSPRKSRRLG